MKVFVLFLHSLKNDISIELLMRCSNNAKSPVFTLFALSR